MSDQPGNRVIMNFADPETAHRFLVWLSDGGGDQEFFRSEDYHGPEIAARIMDYAKAFPAWGYDPKKDGPDREVLVISSEKEES